MSYIRFQQQCTDCEATWNAAFGMVGTTRIAEPATNCPHCGSDKVIKFADDWKGPVGNVLNNPLPEPEPDARSTFFRLMKEEIARAYAKHGTERWGRHEFYGILKEEFDEVEKAVFENLSQEQLVGEMVQVAAVCLRFFETGNRYCVQPPDSLPVL